MKVIHLPTPTCGNSWMLARGEKELGLDSFVYVAVDNKYRYPADKILFNERPCGFIGEMEYLFKAFNEALKIRNQYDVYHFNGGHTLIGNLTRGINNLELPLYKGKIVVTYNGSDARQNFDIMKFENEQERKNYNVKIDQYSRKVDNRKKKAIEKFDKYADVIFALNPDLLNFLPNRARFLPYSLFPVDKNSIIKYKVQKGALRILHAPTNREVKGTKYIIDAIDRIKKKYGQDKVELLLIENLSHAEAMKQYNNADVVIDQLIIGWYGAFAGEVMQMGKPVMVYINEDDLHYLPKDMHNAIKESIINTNPLTIYDKICELIENRDLLEIYSKNGLEYVNEFHDYQKVAMKTKQAYEGKI